MHTHMHLHARTQTNTHTHTHTHTHMDTYTLPSQIRMLTKNLGILVMAVMEMMSTWLWPSIYE